MVGIIVSRQCVLFTIERKLALGDAVTNAAGGAAKVLVTVALVAGHVVKAVNHVHQIAVLIRQVQFHERGAVGGHLGDQTVLVGERVNLCRFTGFGFTKTRFGNGIGIAITGFGFRLAGIIFRGGGTGIHDQDRSRSGGRFKQSWERRLHRANDAHARAGVNPMPARNTRKLRVHHRNHAAFRIEIFLGDFLNGFL